MREGVSAPRRRELGGGECSASRTRAGVAMHVRPSTMRSQGGPLRSARPGEDGTMPRGGRATNSPRLGREARRDGRTGTRGSACGSPESSCPRVWRGTELARRAWHVGTGQPAVRIPIARPRGNGLKVETEAPAEWRQPPEDRCSFHARQARQRDPTPDRCPETEPAIQ